MTILAESFSAGYASLSAWSDLLDRINVFPVADADTGANLRISLEPLPVQVDERFSVDLVEAAEPETDEIEVSLDDNAPDVIEDGRIDLGQYAVEQLALALDPFPRKPGAEFVQPEEPAEISPFAVLKAFKPREDDEKS